MKSWLTSLTRAGLVLACAWSAAAPAQTFPNRPISLAVGFAPGGSADILARLMSQKLAVSLGQPVVVENKPGAGGTIAAAAVANAVPDGHSLLFVTSGHAGSAALYPRLSYDPQKSFAPIARVGSTPVVIVVPSTGPLKSLGDMVDAARKAPGKLNYASGGGGATTTNLTAEFFKSDAKLQMQAIHYKGSGPALTALLASEVDIGFDIPSSALPHVRSGKLRALAVTSLERSSVLPDVPTVSESGLPGFSVTGWFGLMAPAGTPSAVLAQINRAVNEALQHPDVKERLANLAVEAGGGSAEDLARLIETDTRRYGDAIRRLGIKVD